jgi:hypothetical protein
MRILRRTAKSLRDIWAEPAGRGLILGAVIVVGIGTSFYRIVEGWSVIDALYFTVVTLTTIGYGDLHPTTDLSKASPSSSWWRVSASSSASSTSS